jgi:hypothetical protein
MIYYTCNLLKRDMSENAIESIHPDTFLPLSEIQDV